MAIQSFIITIIKCRGFYFFGGGGGGEFKVKKANKTFVSTNAAGFY